jgi:hypothetical protein
LWTSVLAGYALVTLGALAPGSTHVKCNQQCNAGYSADVDDCRFQFNTPADAHVKARLFASTSLAANFRECLARVSGFGDGGVGPCRTLPDAPAPPKLRDRVRGWDVEFESGLLQR